MNKFIELECNNVKLFININHIVMITQDEGSTGCILYLSDYKLGVGDEKVFHLENINVSELKKTIENA
jgi:hypothetical protein